MPYEITMLVNYKIVAAPNKNAKEVRPISKNTKFVSNSRDGDYFQHPEGWVCQWKGSEKALTFVLIEQPPDPPPPDNSITAIKRSGRIATLLVDWQNPKWDYKVRGVGLQWPPQTVTFNHVPQDGKGKRIPLTSKMLSQSLRMNGLKVATKILIPSAGWINSPTIPQTIERLTWAANHVVVIENQGDYSRIYAPDCRETRGEDFFSKDGRLVVHKFNAVGLRNKIPTMIKLGAGFDCYTPFVSDGDMWIRTEFLEMWPELPFTLNYGTQIIEVELYGNKYFGLRADGTKILLCDQFGYYTNWKISSPNVPV